MFKRAKNFGSKFTKNPQLTWTPIIFLYFANNAFNNTFHNTKETASWNFQRAQRNGVITLLEGGAGGGVGSEESFLLFPTTDQPLTDLKKGGGGIVREEKLLKSKSLPQFIKEFQFDKIYDFKQRAPVGQ